MTMRLHGKRPTAANERTIERRELEEGAQRLSDAVPTLRSLRIQVEEQHGLGTISHVRHVIVGRAAAHFMIACGDAACNSLGHDVTYDVLRALRARMPAFEGRDHCNGMVGPASCQRLIVYKLTAVYAA